MSLLKPIFLFSCLVSAVRGFVTPRAFAASGVAATTNPLPHYTKALYLDPSPLELDPLLTIKNELAVATTTLSLPDDFIDPSLASKAATGARGVISLIFSFVGGFVIFSLVLALIVAFFVVPSAVKELEAMATEKYPDLWKEYQARLGEGEDLTVRPDLVQELANKIQQLELQEFDRQAAAFVAELEEKEENSSEKERSSSDVTIDVKSSSQKEQKDS